MKKKKRARKAPNNYAKYDYSGQDLANLKITL